MMMQETQDRDDQSSFESERSYVQRVWVEPEIGLAGNGEQHGRQGCRWAWA